MEARNCTVTTVSSKPCRRSSRRTCSMIGRLTTGSIGFGWLAVIGRSRVPSPPAITTAFTAAQPPYLPPTLSPRGLPPAPPVGLVLGDAPPGPPVGLVRGADPPRPPVR